jgi:predicted deacetylase
MKIFVDVAPGTEFVDGWAADLAPVRLSLQPDGSFAAQVDLAEVPAGTHELLLAADGASVAFAKLEFRRSAPYYVLVTTDWDFADPSQRAIGYQNRMHTEHPELRLTHFIGPYTFTDPAVDVARQQELVAWLVEQRDMFRDEIALHIHPYCNFVESAGLTCITDQSTVYAVDETGYTIKCAAYDRAQFGTLLEHAATLFEQNGLNRPKTFRAGGWTASADTLAALADQGFTADTSALNWARIEEWDGVENGELYRWNMENWGPIGDTSQPYYPNVANPISADAPNLTLLEVPDNGAMIDYVSLEEMNGLFDSNWNGEPLAAPSVLMMGFHPAPGFSDAEFVRVDGFLDYADLRLATNGLGPVVYITLDDLVPVFAR